jgi:hypothetical protein
MQVAEGDEYKENITTKTCKTPMIRCQQYLPHHRKLYSEV